MVVSDKVREMFFREHGYSLMDASHVQYHVTRESDNRCRGDVDGRITVLAKRISMKSGYVPRE